MRLELQDYADMHHENNGYILLGFAAFGAGIALVATFACCCTARQNPTLLYMVVSSILAELKVLSRFE